MGWPDTSVALTLDRCRRRSVAFLQSMAVLDGDTMYWKHSAEHVPDLAPDHVLYGTWAGAMATVLLVGHDALDESECRAVAATLNGFQCPDGTFRMTRAWRDAGLDVDDEYEMYHATNYALGALMLIGVEPRHPLRFIERFRSATVLQRWLAARDLSSPWREGNNIVNLASFLAVLAQRGERWAGDRLNEVAQWHDARQNPSTGFWDQGDDGSAESLLFGMAGAAHNLHLYYFLERQVPRLERLIDSCLALGYLGIRSACIDVDMVDILAHLRCANYRSRDVDRVLGRYLIELLQVQNSDGGFSDTFVAPQTTYGVTRPPLESVTWATWFRLVAIGMAASVLLGNQASAWVFRNTLGMGYFNPTHAGSTASSRTGGPRSSPLPLFASWLGVNRELRFARQRIVLRAKRWTSGLGRRHLWSGERGPLDDHAKSKAGRR